MKRGMTLVEVLITLTIFGILIPAVLVVTFQALSSYRKIQRAASEVLKDTSGLSVMDIYTHLSLLYGQNFEEITVKPYSVSGKIRTRATSEDEVYEATLLARRTPKGTGVFWITDGSEEVLIPPSENFDVRFSTNTKLVEMFGPSVVVSVVDNSGKKWNFLIPLINVGVSTR